MSSILEATLKSRAFSLNFEQFHLTDFWNIFFFGEIIACTIRNKSKFTFFPI